MLKGNCDASTFQKTRLDWNTTSSSSKEGQAIRLSIEEYTRTHPCKQNGIYCGVLPDSIINSSRLNWGDFEE